MSQEKPDIHPKIQEDGGTNHQIRESTMSQEEPDIHPKIQEDGGTNHQIRESTMSQEEPDIHPKIQEDGGTNHQIAQNPFFNQPSDQRATDQTKDSLLDIKDNDVNTCVDEHRSSPRMGQIRVADVLPVQPV